MEKKKSDDNSSVKLILIVDLVFWHNNITRVYKIQLIIILWKLQFNYDQLLTNIF